MTLVLRNAKGSKLTIQEMDGNLNYLEGLSNSKLPSSSFNDFTSSYTTGSFTGSFTGDGSGLTGIPGVTPIDTASFATTGSNTFVGNQTISGSAIFIDSVTIPGSGSFVNTLHRNTNSYSIRGNGAGLYNIIEPGEGNLTFAIRRITTRDIVDAITTNVTDAEDRTHQDIAVSTTSGDGQGARFNIVVSGGTVTKLTIRDIPITNPNYALLGQPANNQGIGYKPGDTITISSNSFDGATKPTNDLVITLREQDFETYIGHSHLLTFDHISTSKVLNLTGSFVVSDKLTVGDSNTNDGSHAVAVGMNHTISSAGDFSIVAGYQNDASHEGCAVFGAYNETGNFSQTIVGEYNLVNNIDSAFIIGNGTGTGDRKNLLIASNNTVQVTGSLDVTGSMETDGFVILSQVSSSLDFADDSAAASGGVPLGGLYRNGNAVQIRLS